MEYNNEALKQLSEQVARLHKIKAMLDSLYSQRQELECLLEQKERLQRELETWVANA